jgi:hypothetical protein
VSKLLKVQLDRCGGRRVLAVAASVGIFAAAPHARAATVEWSSPADCERAEVVEARVEELVGRPLASVDEPNFQVNVTEAPGQWNLTLVTRTGGGTSRRELSGQSCGEVTEAAAVAMAMAIRAAVPNASENSEPSPPAETPAPAPPATAASPARDRPTPAPHPKSSGARLGGVVGIAALLDTAALPAPTFGVAVGAGLRWGWLRAELQGAAFAPQTASLGEGRSAEFGLLSGALLGCIEPPTPGVAVFGCGGFELGSLSGEGHGVSNPEVGAALWAALRLEAGAEYKVNPALGLAARLGVAVPLERRQFVLDGEPVYRPAALGVRAALGVDFLW